MKTLVHNGVDVIVQNGQKSFVDTLVSKGISFVELPVLISRQIRVLQYSANSIVKYAIVELFDGGEGDDWYQIFITSSAPADGWNELYTDCLRQLNGEKPTKIKSRLKMAILAIDRVITEKKNKNMVAVILKVYAIVNAIIGCIIGLSGLSDSYNEIFNMVYTIFLGACIVVSFGIYAFGEVVQLLQDIKDGTKGTITTIQKQNNNDNDELPSI